MRQYVVSWTVDIFDAETPEDAARMAFAMMEAVNPDDPVGANVFEVEDTETFQKHLVDLGAKAQK